MCARVITGLTLPTQQAAEALAAEAHPYLRQLAPDGVSSTVCLVSEAGPLQANNPIGSPG